MAFTDNELTPVQLAKDFLKYTNTSVFLTGKAGTGKTTFLKSLQDTQKRFAIMAPTGVAAVNAGGVTINSFLKIPPSLFIPADTVDMFSENKILTRKTLIDQLSLSKEKMAVIKKLDLLVIDEVSMLRADLLDAIDLVLQHVRTNNEVFGGIQVLLIGDLFQLPPIVKGKDMPILNQYYASPFFFDALVYKRSKPITIELTEIYRQNDPIFISLLNNIRNNEITKHDLDTLERYYQPGFASLSNPKPIVLASHNHPADLINEQELNKLPGLVYEFVGEITGKVDETVLPTEKNLKLKTGAQVMLLKNDTGDNKKYYNGKIGIITRINEHELYVTFKNEPEVKIEKESWKTINYQSSSGQNSITEEFVGEYKQFPVRLAWAITIHKSQGLTFDEAVIDAGNSFTTGQVYVALSRLKSLTGLTLLSRITSEILRVNPEVTKFMSGALAREQIGLILDSEKNNYIFQLAKTIYSFNELTELLEVHEKNYLKWKLPNKETARVLIEQLIAEVENLIVVGTRFNSEIQQLSEKTEHDFNKLNERLIAASGYFSNKLNASIFDAISLHIKAIPTGADFKSYGSSLAVMQKYINHKILDLKALNTITAGLLSGRSISFEIDKYRQNTLQSEPFKVAVKGKKESKNLSQKQTFDFCKSGRSVAEIAAIRQMAVPTIESHILTFIENGELDILNFIDEVKLQKILSILVDGNDQINDYKEQLGSHYSYFEIRLGMAFKKATNKLPAENVNLFS